MQLWALAAGQGLGYDMDIFDGEVIDSEAVHDAVDQARAALEASGAAVEALHDDD